jgi:D-alanyl-D-alanine carboxypeptidase
VRGAAPSTLDAQASNLQRGRPAIESPPATRTALAPLAVADPAFRLKGPDAPGPGRSSGSVGSAAAVAGGFHIQVGAYATAVEADRQLANVRQRAALVLGASTPLTAPVQKGNRQLFRARFAGFDAPRAAAACHELRRLQIDCFVMRAE